MHSISLSGRAKKEGFAREESQVKFIEAFMNDDTKTTSPSK
jgi:hypothetical protein